jgi:hypothetical protein
MNYGYLKILGKDPVQNVVRSFFMQIQVTLRYVTQSQPRGRAININETFLLPFLAEWRGREGVQGHSVAFYVEG